MNARLPAAERRKQLLGVARRVFAIHGYRGASMESIAEAAGVTKPVLYQHFSSKKALYSSLLDADIAELRHALEHAFTHAESNEDRFKQGFLAYVEFVDAHEDAYRLLFSGGTVDSEFQQRVNRMRSWVASRITSIIQAEAMLPALRAKTLAIAIVGMAESTASWWLSENRPLPVADLADELAGLAWKGFARFPRSADSGSA
jgi:AcrR family transcriptional regulator